MSEHLSEPALLAGLESIQASPKDRGTLDLIVVRPKDRERARLVECQLSAQFGAQGDGRSCPTARPTPTCRSRS